MKNLSLALVATLMAFAAVAEEKQYFTTLPLCRYVDGKAEVRKPGATDWEPMIEQTYYPLGTIFRAGNNAKVTLMLGKECSVKLENGSSVGTLFQPIFDAEGKVIKSRTLVLKGGTISVRVPAIMPAGMLNITCEAFTIKNVAGEVKAEYEDTGDGSKAKIRCVTGGMEIVGRHFHAKDMHAADEVQIRTSDDLLFTELYDTSGDYMVTLDQGVALDLDLETQEHKEVEKKLDWKMTTKSSVRIFRMVPEIGENLSVSIMTFDAAGNMKNRCAFAEKVATVNSGELVVADEKNNEDEAAKLAAEATEDTAVDIDDDEEEESSEEGEAASDDSGSSDDDAEDSDSSDDDDMDF